MLAKLFALGPVIVTACVAASANAQSSRKDGGKTPDTSAGSAYLQQVGAPSDWRTNSGFWIGAGSLTPGDLRTDPRTGAASGSVVDGRGNALTQTGAGEGQSRFAVQWGDRNTGAQAQSGADQRAELVQISPGALMSGKANSGGGNGSEFDVFGFEADPGSSGGRNRSPEPGGSGPVAPSGGNDGRQDQSGRAHRSRLMQIGWSNSASLIQSGTGNIAAAVQIGTGNKGDIRQDGAGLAAILIQQGVGHIADVRQSGSGNASTIVQTGSANSAVVTQR